MFAHPSRAGASVECVGPVVSVSLSRLFPEITVILKLTLRHKTDFNSFSELFSLISLPSNLPPWT